MTIEACVRRGRGVRAALFLLLLGFPAVALAVPAAVPYEGYLSYDDGAPFEGLVDLEMALFPSVEGGSALWGPHLFADVAVEGGALSVVLGDAPGPVLDGAILTGDDVWLEVTVDEVVLTPRQRVLSVPFALRAGDAERLGGEPASAFVTEDSLPSLGVLSVENVGAAALSNAYGDLEGTPDLSVFVRADGTVALSGPWDLGGQPLANVVIGTSAAPPEGASAGQLWWDSVGAALKVYTGTAWLTAGGGAGGAATSLQCSGCVSEQALGFPLAAVAKSGQYVDLTGAPALAPVATSGQYADLSGAPDVAGYALIGDLAPVCWSGSYSDLEGAPDLSGFVPWTALSAVAASGAYADLSGTPDLAGLVHLTDLHPVAQSGAYADLVDAPDPATLLHADGSVALSGPLDVGKQALLNVVIHNKATAPEAPAPGQLWYDTAAKTLKVWTGTLWLGLGGGAGSLPADGLDVVSNGTLSTKFEAGWSSAEVPAAVKDYWPAGTEVTLSVADVGALLSLKVDLSIAHPNASELVVTLTSPGGDTVVLHDHGVGTAEGLVASWPPAAPVAGSLDALLGSDPSGTWTLRVEDTVFSSGAGGMVESFGLSYGILRSSEVAVTGKLTVGGADVGAKLAALEAKLWCLEQCDEQKLGDCRKYGCDGTTQTCMDAGVQPDGTACMNWTGRCVDGTCCMPLTCYLLKAECGTIDDGCGGVLSCGGCTGAAVCYQNACCVPKSCAALGKACGSWNDDCGGVAECGECNEGTICSSEGSCECEVLQCGGSCCPALDGYATSCNVAAHCEYNRLLQTEIWHQKDTWIYVPSGSFPMGSPGSDPAHQIEEGPVHQVVLDKGFFITKNEIAVAQYEACTAAGACPMASVADWDGNGWGLNTADNSRLWHPQNGLTWQHARDLCGWIAQGGRLPSEAEWEYAATGSQHRKYPWGDLPEPSCGNNTAVFEGGSGFGCGVGGSWPVGSKTDGVSAVGAMDLAGNLWEWVEDCWHGSYSYLYEGIPCKAPTDGTAWTTNCSAPSRVMRGGSFANTTPGFGTELRTSARFSNSPGDRSAQIGARCVRPLP